MKSGWRPLLAFGLLALVCAAPVQAKLDSGEFGRTVTKSGPDETQKNIEAAHIAQGQLDRARALLRSGKYVEAGDVSLAAFLEFRRLGTVNEPGIALQIFDAAQRAVESQATSRGESHDSLGAAELLLHARGWFQRLGESNVVTDNERRRFGDMYGDVRERLSLLPEGLVAQGEKLLLVDNVRAARCLDATLGILGPDDKPELSAKAHLIRGEARKLTGHYDDAKDDYLDAIVAYDALRMSGQKGNSEIALGRMYVENRDPKNAETYLRAAIGDFGVAAGAETNADVFNGYKRGQADAEMGLGQVFVGAGRVKAGFEEWKAASLIFAGIEDIEGQCNAISSIAAVQQSNGLFEGAKANLQIALDLLKKKEPKSDSIGNTIGDLLNNLGILAMEVGEYTEAGQYFDKASASGGEYQRACAVANNGALQCVRGDFDGAIADLESAITMFANGHHPFDQGVCYDNLGIVLRATGASQKTADDKFNKAVGLFVRNGCPQSVGEAKVTQIDLYVGMLATPQFIWKTRTRPNPLAKAKVDLANGKYEWALTLFTQEERKAGKNIDLRAACLIGEGLCYEALGKPKDGNAAYNAARKLFEGVFAGMPSDIAEKSMFLSGFMTCFWRVDAYEGLARTYAKLNDPKQSYYYCECTKARSLLQSLSHAPLRPGAQISPTAKQRESSVISDLSYAYQELLTDPGSEDAQDALKAAKERFTQLMSDLQAYYPRYFALRYARPLPAADLELQSREVIVEYEVTADRLLTYVVRPGQTPVVFQKAISRQALESKIQAFRAGFSPAGLADRAANKARISTGKELYKLLLEGPLGKIKAGEKIVIVPDEAIGLIPLEALVVSYPKEIEWGGTSDYAEVLGVKYVQDKWNFCYWQSGSSLTSIRLADRRTPLKKLLLVADCACPEGSLTKTDHYYPEWKRISEFLTPLSAADDLTPYFQGKFGAGLKSFVGDEATRARVMTELGKTSYAAVVFATHGTRDVVGAANKGSSDVSDGASWLGEPVLFLSYIKERGVRDCALTMADVASIDLTGTDTAALMACESVNGKVITGEGVMGMGRAFQGAGVRTVLASLWSVENKSANLITKEFIGSIMNGTDKVTALTAARSDLRKNGYDHPYFWAPFILIGESAGISYVPIRTVRPATASPRHSSGSGRRPAHARGASHGRSR